MKPNFALNLSQEGLSLLRRAKGGWQIIGSVALDDEELTAKLGYLRKTATELAGGQLASKLVIPNSEILYREVEMSGHTDQERNQSVASALDGATPYEVAELAFDWADAGGGMALVAAVARVTLDEAEGFATEHRFNPVSFVAIPDGENFVGEPCFGETKLCRSILADGETVENDPGPIVVVGDHDPSSAPIPEEVGEELSETSAEDLADEAIQSTDNTAGPSSDAAESLETSADIQTATSAATFSSTRLAGQAEDSDDAAPNLHLQTPRFALYADRSRPDMDTANGLDASRANSVSLPVSVTAPNVPDVDLEALAETTPPEADISLQSAGQGHTYQPNTDYSSLALSGGPDRLQTPVRPSVFELSDPISRPGNKKLIGMTLALGMVAMILLAILVSSVFFDRPISATQLLNGFDRNGTDLTAETLTQPQIVASPIQQSDAVPLSQFEQPTAPLQPEQTVAAGSVDAFAADDPTLQVAALSPPDQLRNPAVALGESELADSDPGQPILGEITAAEALVIESSTGVWVLAPIPPVDLEAEKLDDFYVASIDRAVLGHDAFALSKIDNALNDFSPGEFASPAPAGTAFDLDDRGFVKPTQQGALTADGVRILLGTSTTGPIARPVDTGAAELAAVNPQQLPNTRPTLRPANLVEINERAELGGLTRLELAAKRPLARPASPQQSADVTDLAPTELAVLTSRAPKARPSEFAAVVAKARTVAAVAAATQTTAIAAAPAAPIIPTTASVAREATIGNAINLAQVNLIGVYGSSGDRRALIRLKNGRYLKVQIGDRLDGGKVAAIDGEKLQYIKAGRMVTLDIAS